MTGNPDPKPTRRPSSRRRRQALALKQAGVNVGELRRRFLLDHRECATGCGHPATNCHRVVHGSSGGEETPENSVGLCGFGNAAGCHGLVHAGDHVTRHLVGEAVGVRPEVVAYAVRVLGETAGRSYLARRYFMEV